MKNSMRSNIDMHANEFFTLWYGPNPTQLETQFVELFFYSTHKTPAPTLMTVTIINSKALMPRHKTFGGKIGEFGNQVSIDVLLKHNKKTIYISFLLSFESNASLSFSSTYSHPQSITLSVSHHPALTPNL